MIGNNTIIMKYNPLPSLERINEILEYDSETGIFTWKIAKGPKPAGSEAGQKWSDYVVIGIDNKHYLAHRIAWLIITGEDPEDRIVDHDDLDKRNNRANNLRLATPSENTAKTLHGEPKCYQRTGKNRDLFQAVFTVMGKRTTCGTFKTAEEASKVGREARRIARGL